MGYIQKQSVVKWVRYLGIFSESKSCTYVLYNLFATNYNIVTTSRILYIKDVFTISFIMSFLGDNVIMCLTKVSLENRRGLAYTPFYYTHMNWFIKNDKNQSHKPYFFWGKKWFNIWATPFKSRFLFVFNFKHHLFDIQLNWRVLKF